MFLSEGKCFDRAFPTVSNRKYLHIKVRVLF